MAERFLLADLGGTHTRVGLGGPLGLDAASVRTYRSAAHADLAAILATYLGEFPGPVRAICAGVAGPVRDNRAQLTNLDWVVDAPALQKSIGAKSVHLINDLQAQGYALDDLPDDSLTPILAGAAPAPKDATRLVMGLGTGCNIAVVYQTSKGLFVPPSETGHSSLPHMDGDAGGLIAHLSQTQFHKPIEAALSGAGLSRIFRYLSGDTLPTEQIIRCHDKGDIEATAALTLFTEILGIVAGNIALAHLPSGGLYLTGGLARAIAPYLSEFGFSDHFTTKGPYTPLLRDIPVALICDDAAALHGCNRFGLMQ